MTGKLHQTLTVIAAIVVMLAGLVIITDPSTLGVSADTWKIVSGWVALGSGIFSGLATVLRANLVPGVTTGVGNETPAITETVTRSTTTQP